MTKQEIHQRFVQRITEELASITAAAKTSFATATSDDHHAEHKYDTFKLESSYLARGQAKRVEELRRALSGLQAQPLTALHNKSRIQLGALVRLESGDGRRRTLFIGSAAGGETILADGEEITIVTSQSPMGQAVLGKTAGDTFELKIGIDRQVFTIRSVE
jgi:transcription elongation GreA/GreB family factor